VSEQEIQQYIRIHRVTLAARRIYGFAKIVRRRWVDRIKNEVAVLAQGTQQSTARLLHAHRNRAARETCCQLGDPDMDRFRRVLNLAVFAPESTWNMQAPGVLLIGPVDGKKGGPFRFRDSRRLIRHRVSPEDDMASRRGWSPCERLIVEPGLNRDPDDI
jgi:hypothetical protein